MPGIKSLDISVSDLVINRLRLIDSAPMSSTTKKALKIIWNILVTAFASFSTLVLLRRIIPQFTHAEEPVMVAAGLEGVGVLLLLLVACATLTSPLWFRCASWFRIILGLLLVAMLIGSYYVAQTFHKSFGPNLFGVMAGDHIAFFVSYVAVTFPLLVFGWGYPALILRLFARKPNHHRA